MATGSLPFLVWLIQTKRRTHVSHFLPGKSVQHCMKLHQAIITSPTTRSLLLPRLGIPDTVAVSSEFRDVPSSNHRTSHASPALEGESSVNRGRSKPEAFTAAQSLWVEGTHQYFYTSKQFKDIQSIRQHVACHIVHYIATCKTAFKLQRTFATSA